MVSAGLIPRNRLRWVPAELRLAHEYCYLLHDECARILVEYERAEAHNIRIQFHDKAAAVEFERLCDEQDTIAALRITGRDIVAQRVILNQLTMALVADCMHHIYEALHCLEKRKIVVALNLLRKPLTDNLLYLSWMFADETAFYDAFSADSPHSIKDSVLKAKRSEILKAAMEKTELSGALDWESIDEFLFDKSSDIGLQRLFQHAVHLVTVRHVALQTEPENLNFIFVNAMDDDTYQHIYLLLPCVMLFLSHVIIGLFTRIAEPEVGGKNAFKVRSMLGFSLLRGDEGIANAQEILAALTSLTCPYCGLALKLSRHNAARLLLSESYRCSSCRRISPFPFSWLF